MFNVFILSSLLSLTSVSTSHPTTDADHYVAPIEEIIITEEINHEEEALEIIEPVTLAEDDTYELEAIVYEEVYEEFYTEEPVYEEPIEVAVEVEAPAPDSSGIYLGEFQATSYAVGDGYTPNTYTRNGMDVSNTIYTPDGLRMIAVDMNVIPLNSIVRVHVPGWEPFIAMAADTGGAIQGHIIDILQESPEQARGFGRQFGIAIYLLN